MPRRWTQEWGRVVFEAPTLAEVMAEAGATVDELIASGIDPDTFKIDVQAYPAPPTVMVMWKAAERDG